MEAALALTLPVFAIVLLGYLAVRFNYIPQAAADGLLRFVVAVAVPLVVFRAMLRVGVPNNLGNVFEIWGAYFLAALAVMLIGYFGARAVPDLRRDGTAIALAGSHGNLMVAGLPAVIMILGIKYVFALSLVVGLHGLVMALLAAVVPAVASGKTKSMAGDLKAAAVAQVKSPILIALVLGVVLNEAGLALPAQVDTVILQLGNNLVAPLALFALGGVLVRYSFGKDRTEAAAVAALKLVAFPLIAWLLAKHLFTLPNSWVWVAVLLAAMPAGFQLDAPEGQAVEAPRTAVLASTLAAVVTVTAATMVLRG